jgi:ubiquinone/menaquinone biosynthesis C-methylase UbiE
MCEDALAMSLPDESFDGAVCFTMLHHVPSVAKQDRLLREVARVLRPGGLFAGTDSLHSRSFRLLHVFDTMVVVDPVSFPGRLKAAGFSQFTSPRLGWWSPNVSTRVKFTTHSRAGVGWPS